MSSLRSGARTGWRLGVGVVTLVLGSSVQAQDASAGKDVYGPCAACHGGNGEGGKDGEYPRVASQPTTFIVEQLKAFQKRKRYNLPMFPYTEPRELSDSDMADVAAYLSALVLPSKAPVFKDSDSALDRLLAMEKVLVVPRVEGDTDAGKKVYRKRCAGCHGHAALGRKSAPRLVGQYPNYLMRQMELFRKGVRVHDEENPAEGVLAKLSEADLTNVLAWLTAIQDAEPEPEEKHSTE